MGFINNNFKIILYAGIAVYLIISITIIVFGVIGDNTILLVIGSVMFPCVSVFIHVFGQFLESLR